MDGGRTATNHGGSAQGLEPFCRHLKFVVTGLGDFLAELTFSIGGGFHGDSICRPQYCDMSFRNLASVGIVHGPANQETGLPQAWPVQSEEQKKTPGKLPQDVHKQPSKRDRSPARDESPIPKPRKLPVPERGLNCLFQMRIVVLAWRMEHFLPDVFGFLASLSYSVSMKFSGTRIWTFALLTATFFSPLMRGQAAEKATGLVGENPAATSQPLAILDTDIGDDIDDAFALALVLRSPEIHLLGITTTFGDTELRARLLDRYLAAVGRTDLPVAAGVPTPHSNVFTQAAYAERQPDRKHDDGVRFLLDQIRAHPGQITLIGIGPLVNVGAAIQRDPATFRKLKRVVLMGGSVYRGYDDGSGSRRPAEPEWNIARDPAGAKALLASGVPVFMMPLDSTQIHLEEPARDRLFALGSPLTDQLTLLYHQWKAGTDNHSPTPTLFDPVAAAFAIRPDLCPMTSLRLEVEDNGLTKPVPGDPNTQVCLKSDPDAFLNFLLSRIGEGAPKH